jgi:hypothetical protein
MTTTIKTRVMANVAVIRAARVLTSMPALKIYALILSVWGIGRLVWVSKVFENFFAVWQNGFGSALEYLLVAIRHAEFGVQGLLLVSAIAAISLFVDATRTPARRLAA